MGIPLGHKLKMMKKIKDMRAEKGMGGIQYQEGVSSKPVTQHQYEELPDPTKTQEAPQQSILKPKRQPDGVDNSKIGMTLLKDGVYDENESHAGFLEALNAFRGKKTEETPK